MCVGDCGGGTAAAAGLLCCKLSGLDEVWVSEITMRLWPQENS